MLENKAVHDFESLPVAKAVFKNAIPAMAAMLMVLVYNLADTFFIGQTNDALQVAAVSLATPVFLLFMAMGTVFGIGGTSVISRALGEKRDDYARKVCAFCMWGCVIVGVVMAACFLIFMDQILAVIGASADTWAYAKTYLGIVSFSGPFMLIANCYSNVVRAEGQSGKAMMGQVIGNLLNIILDPILILGFGWDIAGAAIATVIGNVFGAVYYILFYVRGGSVLSIRLRDAAIGDKVMYSVLAIGVPAALASILMSVSQILINSEMAQYSDMAVAGMGVAMKVLMITGMLCMGLGQGVQPLLGYCVGARLWQRFRAVLRFSLTFAFILGAALTALCYIFTEQLVGAFLTDAAAFDYAYTFSRIMLVTSVIFGVFYVLINAIQAMGAGGAALIINVSRQGIIFIPALYILSAWLGLTGLVWAQPVADVLSFMLAIVLYSRTYRRLSRSVAEPASQRAAA